MERVVKKHHRKPVGLNQVGVPPFVFNKCGFEGHANNKGLVGNACWNNVLSAFGPVNDGGFDHAEGDVDFIMPFNGTNIAVFEDAQGFQGFGVGHSSLGYVAKQVEARETKMTPVTIDYDFCNPIML